MGEIPSARLRHYTTGFSAASGNITGLGLGYLVPYMLNAAEWNWGLKTCWFFAGVGAPFVVATWFLVPETRQYVSFRLNPSPYALHKTFNLHLLVARPAN